MLVARAGERGRVAVTPLEPSQSRTLPLACRIVPPSDHIHEPEVEGQELVAPDVVGQEDADDDALPAPSVGTSAPRIQAASPLPKMRHDLRTPLNQIIGYTELLQETAGDDVQPDLAKIRTAALNLLDGLNRAFDQIAGMITGTTPEAPPVESIPRSLAATRAQVTPADEAAHPSPYRGARLLVVDDNEMNRAVLSQRLQR